MVKSPPVNAGDVKDTGSNTELERFPGGGHDNPFQYSCLENPTDRGAWWATVYRVTKSWTWLKRVNVHTRILVTAKCGSEGKARAPSPTLQFLILLVNPTTLGWSLLTAPCSYSGNHSRFKWFSWKLWKMSFSHQQHLYLMHLTLWI